jgi:hypothetical protein
MISSSILILPSLASFSRIGPKSAYFIAVDARNLLPFGQFHPSSFLGAFTISQIQALWLMDDIFINRRKNMALNQF